nr:NADH dehydrogenase subunit 2 [Aspidomorpha difformis]
MSKFYNLLFINFLIFSSLITISSYSWLVMWMGMEINLLSMIPIMLYKKNVYTSESSMKYFLIQSLASTLLIFSMIMMEKNFILSSMKTNPYYLIIEISLLMKLGMAPFHSWLPEVLEGLNWFSYFWMITWQKLAPMIVLMMILKMNTIMTLSIIMTSLISGILGLNQISLRKILAYSSMNHLSWMIMSMMYMSWIWMFYLVIYFISNLNLIFYFSKLNLFYINQINLLTNNKFLKMFFLMNFLSLSGIPPFIGFFPKWLTISFLIFNFQMILPLILITSSLIHMFMYLRLLLPSLMMKMPSYKMNKFKFNYMMMMNFLFVFSMPLCNIFM